MVTGISPATLERIQQLKKEEPKTYIKIITKHPSVERAVRTGGGGGTATPIPAKKIIVESKPAQVPVTSPSSVEGISPTVQADIQRRIREAEASKQASLSRSLRVSPTASQLTSERASEIQEVRKEAGTYGRGLSELQEIKAIKEYYDTTTKAAAATPLTEKIERIREEEPLGEPTTKQTEMSIFGKVGAVWSGMTGGTFFKLGGAPTAVSREVVGREFQKTISATGLPFIPRPTLTPPLPPGLPETSLARFQTESLKSEKIFRESGALTQAQQKEQIPMIESSFERIGKAGKVAEEHPEAYPTYERIVLKEVRQLREKGIEIKATPTGELIPTSTALNKTISTPGAKILSGLPKPLAGAWIGLATARQFGIAAATASPLGSVGVLPYIGSKIAALPKVARVGTYVATGGLAVGGTGFRAYRGYQLGAIEGVPVRGAIAGGAEALGQIGGFIVGGAAGTQARYARVQEQVIARKFTESKLQLRAGEIYRVKGDVIGGQAKQVEHFETRFPGTKYKLQSYARLSTGYGKEAGAGRVEIISQFDKVPRGLPKEYTTIGRTLEAHPMARARLFTVSSKGSTYFTQDVLTKKLMLQQISKPQAEYLRFITQAKTVGKPVSVGKQIPKDVWTYGEKYLFRTGIKTQKVAGLGEFGQAKPETLFGTQQITLFDKPQKVGGISVQKFFAIGKTKGIGAGYFQQAAKQTTITIQTDRGISILPVGKKAQVSLLPQLFQARPTIKPTVPLTGVRPQIITTSKDFLSPQLTKIAPSIYAKQFGLVAPGIVSITAGAIGTKQFLTPRLKQFQIPTSRLSQMQTSIQTPMQPQIPIQSQPQLLTQELVTPLTTTTITPPPTTTTIPTTPTSTFIFTPIIPFMLPSGFFGEGKRKPQTKKRPYRYQASLGAIGLGLTSTKQPKGIAKVFLRPVIVKKKRKKK